MNVIFFTQSCMYVRMSVFLPRVRYITRSNFLLPYWLLPPRAPVRVPAPLPTPTTLSTFAFGLHSNSSSHPLQQPMKTHQAPHRKVPFLQLFSFTSRHFFSLSSKFSHFLLYLFYITFSHHTFFTPLHLDRISCHHHSHSHKDFY